MDVRRTCRRGTSVDGEWNDNQYIMWVEGRTRETTVFGEDFRRARGVWARFGESRPFVDDVPDNPGQATRPLVMAYHINVGFPQLDENSS